MVAKRNYKKERKYDSKPKVKAARAARNRARYAMIKAGKAAVGDGKDVSHKDDNTNNNKASNLKSGSRAKNRSYPRNAKAGRKGGKTPTAKTTARSKKMATTKKRKAKKK